MLSAVVLISGRGSNLRALIQATKQRGLALNIQAVISNRTQADGLGLARDAGFETAVVEHTTYRKRAEFESELAAKIDDKSPDLVILAGFMRILSDSFVQRYLGTMINIHPSLLPRHPGLNTHRNVLQSGDRWHGASIHFVTPKLDSGPVLSQVRIPVRNSDTPDSLAARLLPREHLLLTHSVELFTTHSVKLSDDKIFINKQYLSQPLVLADDNAWTRFDFASDQPTA